MKRWRTGGAGGFLALSLAVTPMLGAQSVTPLAAGREAPDFSLPAATSSGVLPQQIRLSELRGNTVVLAFFYQARTKG